MAQDLRRSFSLALRRSGQSPGLTVAVVLTLALGFGTNVTIFSVGRLNAVKVSLDGGPFDPSTGTTDPSRLARDRQKLRELGRQVRDRILR